MDHDTSRAHEETLLRRLRAGDEDAFVELVQRHHAAMVRLAGTFVGDHGAAEEVVQETWLGVLRGLHDFEARSSLKTWIFRILVNRARTRGARDGRTKPFSDLPEPGDEETLADRFSADGRWLIPPPAWAARDPEDVLIGRETMHALERAIDALPPAQRAVLVLRDIEEVETPEACNILSVSETNLRVLLHRARTRVRAALQDRVKRQ